MLFHPPTNTTLKKGKKGRRKVRRMCFTSQPKEKRIFPEKRKVMKGNKLLISNT